MTIFFATIGSERRWFSSYCNKKGCDTMKFLFFCFCLFLYIKLRKRINKKERRINMLIKKKCKPNGLKQNGRGFYVPNDKIPAYMKYVKQQKKKGKGYIVL